MNAFIDLSFGDGEYTFKLPARQIFALEEKAGTGVLAIYYQVADGTAKLATLLEIVRQGLIGGEHGVVNGEAIKVNHHLANHLVSTYAEPPASTIQELTKLVTAILAACITGYEPTNEAEKKSGKPKTRKRKAAKASA